MTRMLPSRYQTYGKPPLKVKAVPMSNRHVQAPIKGLSLAAKLGGSDPLVAPILTNYVVEDDRIQCRAGYKLIRDKGDGLPVVTLVPFYGEPSQMLAASGGRLWDIFTGDDRRTGFGNDDWAWTSFSDLGVADYTVMANGVNGVWSWDGGSLPDGAPLTVTDISKANPAVATVADASGLAEGAHVVIAGITGDFAFVNGTRIIGNITATTFDIYGVDTSAVVGAFAGSATATPLGSFIHEAITAPAAEPWIEPLKFDKVLSHMNRLWFADSVNLAVYYLPLMQKEGEVKMIPLNALFKRGGTIRAIYTWSVDGGTGIDDKLVIFSTNGECVIYSGIDPDSEFSLDGIFRFDSPMSKHAIVNYGGELYVLISTGLVPMSTLMRAESENLGKTDREVISFFLREAVDHRAEPGWQAFMNPSTSRVFCNVPLGAGRYDQLIRHMPRPVWSRFEGCNARHWGWIDPYVYFGTDDGKIFQMHPTHLSDDGEAIRCDVQAAWRDYGYAGKKHFKLVNAYYASNGAAAAIALDVAVDYDYRAPTNEPEVTSSFGTSKWNTAKWNAAKWSLPNVATNLWTGVGHRGLVGAPRMVTLVKNCTWSVSGWDVAYEEGSIL